MSELGGAGWLVQGDPWWDDAAQAFFIVPFIKSITDALEHAYEERGNQQRRDAAVEFVAPYNADVVAVDYWVPVLEQLAAPKAESRQVRRARERREAKARAKVAA